MLLLLRDNLLHSGLEIADPTDSVADGFQIRPALGGIALAPQGEVPPGKALHRPNGGVLWLPVGIALTFEGDIGGERTLVGHIAIVVEILANDMEAETALNAARVRPP